LGEAPQNARRCVLLGTMTWPYPKQVSSNGHLPVIHHDARTPTVCDPNVMPRSVVSKAPVAENPKKPDARKRVASKTTKAPVVTPVDIKKKAAIKPVAKVRKEKVRKVKDRFSMPEHDFALIDKLKQRAQSQGRAAKKSELLRAGLQALNRLDEVELLAALNRLKS
jgi:hypothetical protein